MKKALSLIMVLMLVMVSVPAFAADATTSASEAWVEPTTTTTTTTTTKVEVPAGAATYTVVKGDVFWKIAKDNGLTTAELVKLNPQIKNPAMIEIGQVIILKMGADVTTETPATPVAGTKLYSGLGMVDNYRTGHTSFNVVAANAVFDQDGKIVSVKMDVTEISPSDFNWIDEADADKVAKGLAMEEEIVTKSELKEEYGMAAKATTGLEWYEQMENFEKFFVGKTTAELRTWFEKNTDANGRPIKIGTELKAEDQAKVDALTADEQAVLADVITGATMSLHDGHGYFLEAVEKAYANRVMIEVAK
ncbi:LysM domain-containing protein [Fusibacter bizertensis]|uniref:LysM domain-containing protein n=1 Tax=Fusibacter bizertensis TaxID=1488331 RepID=A0ABT6NFV7_9FIRM|nr:LysM domain-containing protein [Fusibacter bizertensis]MDH8679277.1 LysM domain-containing protein [Fusibacter bizertensis]